MQNRLIPVKQAWVKYTLPSGQVKPGVVVATKKNQDSVDVNVRWHGGTETTWVSLSDLKCDFRVNMDVQDVPNSRTREPYGEGLVVTTRCLGGREQVLVDFPELGRQIWLPYERLRQIKNVKHRFSVGDKGPVNAAELFRLKSLAYAIELWNENTGSLSSLDIDPLPHQIHLVHHILASGNLNWLIADDVGLGKTIEAGMLMAALKQRGSLRRVLLITPAGLTKQWQEELHYKFKLDNFQIYGEDFTVNETRHWKMYDYVIGSIDRFKEEKHLESLLNAEPWDLIVFDEGHRLTRRQYGQKLDSSQRFDLAAALRKKTDAMVLLTATPHQGMQDKFTALLELLHPERKDEINTLALNPGILSDMVFRNHKADVTDSAGNFIFKGKLTKALRVTASAEALNFDKLLQDYLKKGYAAGEKLKNKGNPIGFVMTIYRKLAASSIAAIQVSLARRKERLQGQLEKEDYEINALKEQDQRYAGEWEEKIRTDAQEFFTGELQLLDDLLNEAKNLRANDAKIQLFLKELVEKILVENPKEKILIFTEYRSTQDYLKDTLHQHFGYDSVELINGSMTHHDRKNAINHFEGNGQFLISTEAGGEGINLQDQCHIMINYDLPWNPMRLVQRIGRLYRYGQAKKVVVFNMHSPGTVDEQIMELMYNRIDQVVSDLCTIGNEFNENLQDDILGEVAELVDVKKILTDATLAGIERTQKSIDDALLLAKESTIKQRELFENAASFNPNENQQELKLSKDHIRAFVLGICQQLNIEVAQIMHDGKVLHLKLPENIQQALSLKRANFKVTLDRVLATKNPELHMLDLDSFIMKYLLAEAKSYGFMGHTAVIKTEAIQGKALMTGLLRWQNEQGNRLRQEYTAYQILNNDQVITNPEAYSQWLLEPAINGTCEIDKEHNKAIFKIATAAADKRLGQVSNQYLHPENNQWINAGWVDN